MKDVNLNAIGNHNKERLELVIESLGADTVASYITSTVTNDEVIEAMTDWLGEILTEEVLCEIEHTYDLKSSQS